MNRLILALLPLALLQDAPTAESIASKADLKVSSTMFRAIERLTALPAAQREAVDKAVAAWPEFYRDALKAELASRDELGELGGKPVLVTMKSEGTIDAHLREFSKQSGIKLVAGWERTIQPGESFPVEFNQVPAMAALLDLCARGKVLPYRNGDTSDLGIEAWAKEVNGFACRNIAVLPSYCTLQKVIDFSGPATWTYQMSNSVLSDPGLKICTWKPTVRLLEAVTDKGVALEEAPHEDRSVLQQEESFEENCTPVYNLALGLRLPADRPDKLARVRFVATALIAKVRRDYKISDFSKKTEDEDFEVTVAEDHSERWQQGANVTVRPKKLKIEQFRAVPITVRLFFKGAPDGLTWSYGRIKGDAVELKSRWYHPNDGGVVVRPGHEAEPTLERAEVSIPTGMVEKKILVELTDLELK